MGEILSSKLADQLLEEIDSGKYLPGTKFPTERELASTLQVSRTSVREAMKILIAKNVLSVKRGIGTFVNINPGIEDDPLGVDAESEEDIIKVLEDWYIVRLTLEGEAMTYIAQYATDEELENIYSLMNKEISQASEKDMSFFSSDQEFHCALASATHNIILQRLIPSLHATVYYDMMKSLFSKLYPRYYNNISNNHSKIAEHLKQRDAIGARVAMQNHMLVALEDIRSLK